ncbi:mannose-1-phosphate guanylyltransferase/mannose-6-phosphate isomerase [Candidatus Pseudothioglobus singularis]|nr:mannose-1-phosphate guanylyltransferase/mannose-6-phosphate isomerase [Candidatus Pseudothioglobus singularis]
MIIPVILSGGSGSRLWPLSRELYPKQFISLVNKTSLFQDTIKRLPNELSAPLVICNEEHRFIVAEQLRQINSSNKGIILEPIGKNTAPAIAIAAIDLMKDNEDPTLLVLSADHLISNNKEFMNSIINAGKIANEGKIVALGVKPNKPEVGYGYIKAKNSNNNYSDISSFTEKPNLKTASKFLESDNYFWNSGIFIVKASVYLNELNKYEPEILSACKKSYLNTPKDQDFIRLDKEEFDKCPNKSIDYAVMEKTKKGVIVPFNGPWSDLGSWSTLWNSKIKDNNNNVIDGDIELNKVHNSYIHSSNRLVAVNDISDLIIIDTQDALLVSSKKNSQDIKSIVEKLKRDNRSESINHRKVLRPWGYFDSIDNGEGFQVKRIVVNPGSKLSLQKHKKRSEHWVIVKGRALITCGEKVFYLDQNQSTFIPKEEIHRLENKEDIPLEIIEIQTGEYLGEDDIIRLEDDYQRN